MEQLTENAFRHATSDAAMMLRFSAGTATMLLALLACIIATSGCGANVHDNVTPLPTLTLSGNWQFTMAPPGDGSFSGGLQGGFLLQTASSATGSLAYSVTSPTNPNPCNSGSAAITATLTGANVALAAVAGSQTYTLTGTMSFDASSMAGTYTSTGGTGRDGSPCGTAQTGLQWTAVLVPPLIGALQGTFHSAGGNAGLIEQDFLVSGALTQGLTNGSSASLSGNLTFANPVSDLTDYPCAASASLSGQISGNTVALQMVTSDGSIIGQIGASGYGVSSLGTVTFVPSRGTYVLNAISGYAYAVYAADCGGGTLQAPADFGSICLALNSSTACAQPITFSPPDVIFDSEPTGSTSTQVVSLSNSSSSNLNNLTLSLSDNGTSVFAATDNCGTLGVPSNGQPFTLVSGQSCVIQITFNPQCTGECPSSFAANVTLDSPTNGMVLTLPITGMAQPSVGAESTANPEFHKSLNRVHNTEATISHLVGNRGSEHAESERDAID